MNTQTHYKTFEAPTPLPPLEYHVLTTRSSHPLPPELFTQPCIIHFGRSATSLAILPSTLTVLTLTSFNMMQYITRLLLLPYITSSPLLPQTQPLSTKHAKQEHGDTFPPNIWRHTTSNSLQRRRRRRSHRPPSPRSLPHPPPAQNQETGPPTLEQRQTVGALEPPSITRKHSRLDLHTIPLSPPPTLGPTQQPVAI